MSSPAAGGAVFTLAFDYHDTAHRPLPRALVDADRVGDYFATYGRLQWHRSGPELAADDPAAIAGNIARWAAAFREARRGQTLVLYIGGHGTLERGEHYTLTGRSPTASPVTGHNALKASAVIDEVLVSGAGQALLIFDSCQSGGAAADILDALRRVMLNEAQPTIDIVALAACLPYEEALSGVLIENMLAALTEGFGDYHPSDRYEYVDVIDLRDELRRRIGTTQTVTVVGMGGRRIIPNPNYRPGKADRRVYFQRLLEDLGEDERQHFLRKAAGTDADGLWLFSGRADASRRIIDWLGRNAEGMLVVTGPPGAGKSAFLGRMAVLADPASQHACRILGILDDGSDTTPPKGVFDAILHLKNRSLEHAAEDLARQLGIELESSTAPARDLKIALADSERSVCLLADALDEAQPGEEGLIALDLLRAVASLPNCRVVVGTRRDHDGRPSIDPTDPGPLLSALRPRFAPWDVIDLGAEVDVNADIRRYIEQGLAESWASPDRRAAAGDAVAVHADGLFLYAQFALRVLETMDEATVDEPAWQERLSHEVGAAGLAEVFERDLGRLADPERVRDVLRPLAFARGRGLPRRRIWPELATALCGDGRAYSETDVALVVRQAGWYLVEATEGGEAVYRLYHQAVSDYFRRGMIDAV